MYISMKCYSELNSSLSATSGWANDALSLQPFPCMFTSLPLNLGLFRVRACAHVHARTHHTQSTTTALMRRAAVITGHHLRQHASPSVAE